MACKIGCCRSRLLGMKGIWIIPVLVVLILSSFGFSQISYSQIPASGDDTKPQSSTNHNGNEFFIDTIAWELQETVLHDPNFGPWEKVLLDDTGSPFELSSFTQMVLNETISVSANSPAFMDWHEEIKTLDLVWSSILVEDENGDIICTSFFIPSPEKCQITIVGNNLWIDFVPPISPGSQFKIQKFLDYSGPPDPADISEIVVWQWPTINNPVGGELIPLDTTMVLVAGAQTNASWMIPVIVSAIGIGIVIARKF